MPIRIHPIRPLFCAALIALLLALQSLAGPSYQIDLDVDWDAGTFAGTSQVTFSNDGAQPLNEVVFRLFANDEGIYGGASIRVASASSGSTELDLSDPSDPTVLSAILPTPLAPGQTTSLTLRFEGAAGRSIAGIPGQTSGYGILTRNTNSFVLTSFYPILAVRDDAGWQTSSTCGVGDALWGEAGDYSVAVSAPPGVVPAGTGTLVRSDVQTDSTVHRFSVESARDFALVLLRGFDEAELQSGSHTFRTWFTPSERGAAERTLLVASGATDVYERRIGPLQFDEVELVGVPLARAAGIEFSGLILLAASYAQRAFEPFYDILVSHEMAHQWFYAAVGTDPAVHPWLDEGPATYLSNLYLEESGRTAQAESEVRRWQDVYRRAKGLYPHLTIAEPTCGYPRSDAYADFAYEGAAWFLHSIRGVIGDDAFFEGLSTYYDAAAGEIATPEDLLSAFERAAGRDLDSLYEAFGLRSE